MLLIPARPWTASGACLAVDPDLFFPQQGESTREAKAVCARCAVRQPCLDFALEQREVFGIWGGLSERERRQLRRDRQAGKVATDVVPDVTITDIADGPPTVNSTLTAKAAGAGRSAGAAAVVVRKPRGAVRPSGHGWRAVQIVERPQLDLPGVPEDGKQPCPLCGQQFRHLAQHLRQRHGHLAAGILRMYGPEVLREHQRKAS